MKTFTFILGLLLVVNGLKAQTTFTVQDNGFTFDPATVNIHVGDSVKFTGSDVHPILQVSEATWNSNGITALAGGFAFPSGSGIVGFPTAGTYYYVCTAHVASHGMKGKIVVSAVTALNEVQVTDIFSLYPVPLRGPDLTVAVRNAVQQPVVVDIYDLDGNLRISKEGNSVDGKYRIDCSALPNGLYLIKMESDQSSAYAKFVKY